MKRTALNRENSNKLQRVYMKYRKVLFKYGAFPILKEHSLAEDAVQETFTRLIGQEHKIIEENERMTRSFLLTVCRNVAIDMYHKRNKLNENAMLWNELEIIQQPEPDLLSGYIQKEMCNTMIEKVKTMDPIYQSVFFMRHDEGYSYEEIASALHVEPATVRKRMGRLRERLIHLMEKEASK